MISRFSWEEPKDAQQSPRGADALRRGIERAANVAADERAHLRHRAQQAQAAGLLDDELAALLAIAKLSEMTGAFDEAAESARQAAALARHLQQEEQELNALDAVAVMLGRCGALSDALELQEQISARHREGAGGRGTVATLLNTAVVTMALPDTALATTLLDDAFRLSRAADDPLSGGRILNDVAAIRMLEQRHDEAARLLQRAVLLRQRSGDHRGLAHTYNNLGVVHAKTGDLVGAIPFLEMAAVLLADVGDLPALVVSLSNNVVVFEQYYLEPARVLRDSFRAAAEALAAESAASLPDANVLRLRPVVVHSGAEAPPEPPTASTIVPDGAALLSTHLLD